MSATSTESRIMLHHHSVQEPGGRPVGIEPISMRISDACHFTGLSRSTLYVLIGQGKIEIVKIGRSSLVLTASLKALLTGKQGTDIPRHGGIRHDRLPEPVSRQAKAEVINSDAPRRGRPRKHPSAA